MKKSFIIIFSMFIIVLCCAGCNNDDIIGKNAMAPSFSKLALAPYEKLIAATDAQVVKNLGEGDTRDFELEENGELYYVLHDRIYEGCLFDPNGLTTVRYYGLDMNDVISGAYKDDPRKVSCVIMSATLPTTTEGVELYETLKQRFGAPAAEGSPFDKSQSYTGFWEKEDFIYQFLYEPNTNTQEDDCGVVFGIVDKGLFSDLSESFTKNSNS